MKTINCYLKNRIIFCIASLFLLIFAPAAWSGDLEWSGLYRVEGYSFDNPYLDRSFAANKEYGVHTLILRPKIVVADGLTIRAQFNIFNSDDENQMGAYFGSGLGTTPSTSSNDSNTTSENQRSEEFRVTQFYLTDVQENGALIVGRAPLQFGLGITHNAGSGLFDHYSDTRDLVGYKMFMGNFYILPMYAKINEGRISGYDDVSEIDLQFQYENPESDVAMGVFYQNRKASRAGNDTPLDPLQGKNPANNAPNDGGFNVKNFNIFYNKEASNWRAGFEIGQQSGDTGVHNIDNKNISLSGFALATELDFKPEGSNKSYSLKAGFATGDDPTTTDEFEGFIFDRNYDVAMMLFNHQLGMVNLLHNELILPNTVGPYSVPEDQTPGERPDVSALSNVYYVSPSFNYKWSDKWSVLTTVTGAWLTSNEVIINGTSHSADKDLGYELDLTLNYKASERVTWQNQIGYFEPGSAWTVNGNDADSILGLVTRAAVSF